MSEEQKTVKTVHDLQQLSILNESRPTGDQHDSTSESRLEGNTARRSLRWTDELHCQHKAGDVTSSRSEDSVEKANEQE